MGILPAVLAPGFRSSDGTINLDGLDDAEVQGAERIHWEFLRETVEMDLPRDDLRDLHALIIGSIHVSDDFLNGLERLVLIARHGVGYEAVDVDACTRHGIMVTNTPGAAATSMATAT